MTGMIQTPTPQTEIASKHTHDSGKEIPSDSTLHYDSKSKWQTVAYQKPRPPLTESQQRALTRRKRDRDEILEDIMADPVQRYRHERKEELGRRVLRMQRSGKHGGQTRKQLWALADSQMSRDDAPTVVTGIKKVREEQQAREHRKRGTAGSRRDAIVEQRAEDGDYRQKEFDKAFIDQIKGTRSQRTVTDKDGEKQPMTQKDLAALVNEAPSVIQDFEAGKLPYDSSLKVKLLWKLGLGGGGSDE
jgi:ribosome-binding protein aMBF1 (putative translation factor)